VDPRLTFHGLRHSAVSIQVFAQGASLVELAAIMGWSRSTAAAMTMRYGHLFPLRKSASRMLSNRRTGTPDGL